MVRGKYLSILAFLCTASACPTEMQLIEICQIDLANKLCHCALADEKYDKPIEYCDKYFAMSEENVRRVGQRLAECRKLEETCGQNESK